MSPRSGVDDLRFLFEASRRLISPDFRKELEVLFTEIQKGTFAQALANEAQTGYPKTQEALENLRSSSLESVGERIRQKLKEGQS